MGLYSFLDNKRTLWLMLVLVAALIVISILTANVYRGVGLQGTVYVWNDAPPGAVSQAYVFDKNNDEALAWTPPAGLDVSPLGGGSVRVRAVYRNETEDNSLSISSRDGRYAKQTARWKVTGDIIMYINVQKDGYQSVDATVTNKSTLFSGGGPRGG